ncbi:MAG: FAD-binding oxidoreductase [Proteobacteria bacterium]|nr:FAD-binding oxidoreductase [Pseudomonadota bacterium]
MSDFDILIIGAGIAGASAGAHLARTHRVAVLERESQPGYHTTGRSAALFSESYGNESVRALTRASRDFFFNPPKDFTDGALVRPRGALYIARQDQMKELEDFIAALDVAADTVRVTPQEALRRCPILRGEAVAAALYEAGAHDVDVNALHQGYLRMLRKSGGQVLTNAAVTSLRYENDLWNVRTSAGDFRAGVVVNAAGAWADEIAKLAAVPPIGLQPLRRTAVLVPAPENMSIDSWPMVIDIAEQFYFKPDAGNIFLTPADETPSPPCDAQPDELDVALAIDHIERATTLSIRRVQSKWAGLRTFAPDRSLVAGFAPSAKGFFWLAGQGGYGIQTAPAMGELTAALVQGNEVPAHITACGVDVRALSPARFTAS